MSVTDHVQSLIAKLDKELAQYPAFTNFERKTSVPKVYAVLGVASLYFFFVFFNIYGEFLVNLAAFVGPGYYTLDTLFTANRANETVIQWLTYWVIYAFLTVFESAVNAVYWFPFYYTFKFVLILWMGLPQTSGALLLFTSFLHPVFARYYPQADSTTAPNLRRLADLAGKSHAHAQ